MTAKRKQFDAVEGRWRSMDGLLRHGVAWRCLGLGYTMAAIFVEGTMARKDRLTRVAVGIGTAMGKADRKEKAGGASRREKSRRAPRTSPALLNFPHLDWVRAGPVFTCVLIPVFT